MAKGLYKEWLTEENLLRISAWARDGLTNEQIAHNMGINVKTLYEWCKKYSDFSNALKKNKEVADIQVENALYKKALGYNTAVKKTFKVKEVIYSENGRKLKEIEKLVDGYDEVHIPPDTTAQIFWLKNRKPETWRDKVETSVTNDGMMGDILDYIKSDKENIDG